jgi:hypothetical protein
MHASMQSTKHTKHISSPKWFGHHCIIEVVQSILALRLRCHVEATIALTSCMLFSQKDVREQYRQQNDKSNQQHRRDIYKSKVHSISGNII